MGDRQQAGEQSRCVTSHPGQLSLAIPLCVGAMSTSESRDVNRRTARCTSPVSVVSQCKLVSGWGLKKRRSAPPYGPYDSGRTLLLRYVQTRNVLDRGTYQLCLTIQIGVDPGIHDSDSYPDCRQDPHRSVPVPCPISQNILSKSVQNSLSPRYNGKLFLVCALFANGEDLCKKSDPGSTKESASPLKSVRLYGLLLYLWSKCAAVIGSNRVTWCKLIWGIDRFTGSPVNMSIDILTDRHIDRSEWSF